MKFLDIYDTARPYLASFVILRQDDKVAMVLRQNTDYMNDHYGLPSGKIEWDETFLSGAVREAKEEAGVDIKPEDLIIAHVGHRHSPEGEGFTDWVDMYFEARKWEGEPHNAEPEKSKQLDWLSLKDLPENIVPHQRAALLSLTKGELYSEFGWN